MSGSASSGDADRICDGGGDRDGRSRPASAASIEVSGVTLGCFGSGGTTLVSPATYAAEGLTFTAANPFDVFTNVAGATTNIRLGQFARGNVNVFAATPPSSPEGPSAVAAR